jgi:hypothetical protein
MREFECSLARMPSLVLLECYPDSLFARLTSARWKRTRTPSTEPATGFRKCMKTAYEMLPYWPSQSEKALVGFVSSSAAKCESAT